MNYDQLVHTVTQNSNYLCVGLDTDADKIPKHIHQNKKGIIHFNKAIIDATLPYCISYKINTAFYEAMGITGWEIIEETLQHIPKTHFTIADAKRGDIGNTSAMYAKTFFETFNFDAVTVAPYMGEDSIKPFLEYENKFTIVLALTSNKGSNDFQYLKADGSFLYETVIKKVSSWATEKNLMFVAGATKPNELIRIRKIIPDHFLLVPGVGAQGGSLEEVSKNALNKKGGLLVNVSRAIIYASSNENFAEAAAAKAKAYANEMKTLM